jgi:cardiolipin synthase (CMP-forming)
MGHCHLVPPSWVNLANSLTLLRLLLVPFVIRAILTRRPVLALALFAAAAATDALDGAAARGLGTVTRSGAYLDPIADKTLLSGVFVALAAARTIPWWLVVLVLGRDVYILLGAAAFMLFTKIRKFPPSVWGKLSTFVQILTVVVWLAGNCLQAPWIHAAASGMIWICAAATLWSGLHYTWRGIGIARAD